MVRETETSHCTSVGNVHQGKLTYKRQEGLQRHAQLLDLDEESVSKLKYLGIFLETKTSMIERINVKITSDRRSQPKMCLPRERILT